MMHARPIRPHRIDSRQSRSMSVAKHVLSRYIASRQLHSIYTFVVSVPAEDFISAQPHNYMYVKMKIWSLDFILNTSIYILLYQKLPIIKYVYTYIPNMQI